MDQRAGARRRAVVLAGHRGDAATARAHLDDDDATVIASALRALARCGELHNDELRAALGHHDAAVRRAAAELAGRPGLLTDEPVELDGVLADDDPTVVEAAAWACGERPPAPTTVATLARLATGHDDALVREAAVASLGAIGDPAGLDAILAASRDKATVRRRAVLALAPFEGPEVDAALQRALGDRDWQVRQAAEDLTAP